MSTPGPSGAPRRPAFLEQAQPVPFWRSPEFLRFALIAFAALSVAAVFLYFQPTQQRISNPPASSTTASGPTDLPSTATLTPEQVAKREAFLSTAFEGALRDQADGARLQDTTGSRKLLDQVAKFDAAEFARRVESPLDYSAARADPAAWRGRYVRLSGLLTHVWAEKLALPVAGRATAWRGQIGSGEDFGEPTLLEFLDRPFPSMSLTNLGMRPVEIEGVVYRLASFESEYQNPKGQTVEAVWEMPWIFVRNIRFLDDSQASTHTFVDEHPSLILGLLAFVIFGGRLLVWWIQSRRRGRRRISEQHATPAPSSIRVMFENKLREKGLPPAPPSPPNP